MNIYEVSMAEYIRLFEDRDERNMMQLLEQGCDDYTYYLGSQSPVATTWIVSFDRIRRSDPVAADLLSFMAFIEPRAISRSILPTIGTEQQMIHAIGTLLGYGFLSQRGREATFDMHSLVHLATRRWNENEGHEREMRQKVLARVAEVFTTDDWEKREVWPQHLPHALRLIASMGDIENEDICKLGYWAGRCLHTDGRVRVAVARLKDVVAIQEKLLAEDHPDRLASQHMLARAYQHDGQTNKAAKLLEHVVAINEKILAEDRPDRLASEAWLLFCSFFQDQVELNRGLSTSERM